MPASIFKKHELSNEQLLLGSILTHDQIMVLENEISSIAETVIKTSLMEDDPNKFVHLAHARGQIKILEFIIERSYRASEGEVSSM